MRIVFWQNCISPHQMPYISNLIKDERVDEVLVVSDRTSYEGRQQMGWNVDMNNWECKIFIAPSEEQIESFLSTRTKDSWHLFSGVRAFKFVFEVFKKSLHYNLRRGIITEIPNTFAYGIANGKPLWLHKLRFMLQDKFYANDVDCVFAMGMRAVNYFKSVHNWKVYPFCYCTETNNLPILDVNEESPLRICYVGSLSVRKSVDTLLRACHKLIRSGIDSFQITIIGDGPEKQRLIDYCKIHKIDNADFIGTQLNSEIPSILNNHDVLILTSVHDGWGAVVNEALLAGLYTICSSACGASDVISDSRIGAVFKTKDMGSLTDIIQNCIKKKSEIRMDRSCRKIWAEEHLGGKAVAKYMVDCLMGEDPMCPWANPFNPMGK